MSKSKSGPDQHTTDADTANPGHADNSASEAALSALTDQFSNTSVMPGLETAVIEEAEVVNFISMGMLMPNGEDAQTRMTKWAVNSPPGTKIQIAQLVGYADSVAWQPGAMKGQEKLPDTIKMTGSFEATVYETGEILTAPDAYLPTMWGKQVMNSLNMAKATDPNARASMILSLGAQATGKAIPYRWTVRTKLRETNPVLEELKALARGGDMRQRQLTLEGIRADNEPADAEHAEAAD